MEEQIGNTNIYYDSFEYYDAISKYYNLLVQYSLFVHNNLNNSNTNALFIYEKGLTLINNIYSQILLYTKNIDLAYYNVQKSYYFFIEYINQIEEIDTMSLDLTINDSIIFVYKKTIYNLDQEFIKTFVEKNAQINEDLIQIKTVFIKINTVFYQLYKYMFLANEEYTIDTFKKDIKKLHKHLFIFEDDSFEFNPMLQILDNYSISLEK